jgi:hypothetical protein
MFDDPDIEYTDDIQSTDYWMDSLTEEYVMQGYSATEARLEMLRNDAFSSPNAAAVEIASRGHEIR